MKADSHLHSYYSVDSQCPMEEMVRRAIELELDEITFTEHVEHDGRPGSDCDYEAYFAGIAQMQEKYKGQIVIRRGIEFGLQDVNMHLFETDFRKYDFDFVILSAHSVHGQHIASGQYEQGKSQDELHRVYYQNLLEMIRLYKNYSILGHVDYIKRYDHFGEYSDDKIINVMEAIFRQVIADGKGIEVNASSFKYGMPDLMPSERLLRLYYDLGGRILTIGSDAHDVVHIADHFEEIKARLRKIGFQEFCTFENRRPIFHAL